MARAPQHGPTDRRLARRNTVATIGDVAREAGVSRSTVSYALSGKRSISLETRDRIDSAIQRLGFTGNAGARALATSKTMAIGVLPHFNACEFQPTVLQSIAAISQAARAYDYDILIVADLDEVRAVERVTSSNLVDGVMLLNVAPHDQRLEPLRQARLPSALIGLPHDTDGLDVFEVDYGGAARLLVDHLCNSGHRDITMICAPGDAFEHGRAYASRFRDAAIEQAARFGVTLHTFHGEAQQPEISRSLNAILDARPETTGLILHDDASVVALPVILRERGVRVPDDLSVVSLHSKYFGPNSLVPYTSVETSPDALGREAVQHLVRRILDPEFAPPAVHLVEPTIRDRGSTSPLTPRSSNGTLGASHVVT